MPKNKDFSYRIEILDECLRSKYRNWSLQNLVAKVNERLQELYGHAASKRTIQDDLRHMKEEKQAPIEKNKIGSATYFFYSDANYSIKNLPIKDEEITYLRDAINMLRQVNDFKIIQDVEDIVNKLQNTVNTNMAGGPSIIQFEKNTAALGIEYVDDIFTAIKEKIVLRIRYQSFKANNPEEHLFCAYLLKEYRNRWFVIGRKENTTSLTILALDRIKGIKTSAQEYICNDFFNSDTYFNHLIGVTIPAGEEPQSIEIKVKANQVPYILTKPIHHSQEIAKRYKNGDVIIRLYLINNYEFRSVLLGYGADMIIIKPLILKEMIKNTFERAVQNYI
jgi:predicted DNA-binding transcriptional regulator YafY